MKVSAQLARHLREFYFGNNWTWSALKEQVSDISWQEATQQVADCNTIATLIFHILFYQNVVARRIAGEHLEVDHEDSFRHPPIQNEDDWQGQLEKLYESAQEFSHQIEQIPDDHLKTELPNKKGSYYRNIQGVIEHNHYHLGQTVLLKKLIRAGIK